MRLHVCWNPEVKAHYVALSVFDNVIGDGYSKPIYIEKTPATRVLQWSCEQRTFLGRTFYSLIRNRSHTYRYNRDIYRDAAAVLGLEIDRSQTLALNLAHLPSNEIVETVTPREAYLSAKQHSPILRSAAEEVARAANISEDCFGLIGSLALDHSVFARDLDFVFSGNIEQLDRVYTWLGSGRTEPSLTPLRRALQGCDAIVCSFFEANPCPYRELVNLRVSQLHLRSYNFCLDHALTPPYLNIQLYSGHSIHDDGELILVVRDTLSRSVLPMGSHFSVDGYPSELSGTPAILVTDVETQIFGVPFHGGLHANP